MQERYFAVKASRDMYSKRRKHRREIAFECGENPSRLEPTTTSGPITEQALRNKTASFQYVTP